jgi:Transposase, Mutator family
MRSGTRAKTVLTEAGGQVALNVPRDRGSVSPQIGKKRQHRLCGVDEIVLPLYAKGLSHTAVQTAQPSPQASGAVLSCPMNTIRRRRSALVWCGDMGAPPRFRIGDPIRSRPEWRAEGARETPKIQS